MWQKKEELSSQKQKKALTRGEFAEHKNETLKSFVAVAKGQNKGFETVRPYFKFVNDVNIDLENSLLKELFFMIKNMQGQVCAFSASVLLSHCSFFLFKSSSNCHIPSTSV